MLSKDTLAPQTANPAHGVEPVQHREAIPGCPAAPPPKGAFRSLKLLLGRLILRACPSGSKFEVCDGCHLRVFCKCAHEKFVTASALEGKFWAVIALAAGLVLLSALISFLHRS